LKGDHDSLQKKGQTWYCTHMHALHWWTPKSILHCTAAVGASNVLASSSSSSSCS
jgi:hypothetical protein